MTSGIMAEAPARIKAPDALGAGRVYRRLALCYLCRPLTTTAAPLAAPKDKEVAAMADEPRITLEEVHRVARLAQLTLEDDEAEALRGDLDAILGYVAQLEALDLEGVEPTTHAVPLALPLRADEVVKTLTRQEVLANAPEQAQGMFRVPRVVEGGN